MNTEEESKILREITQLRREVRSLRTWMIFIGLGVGILLFVPQLVPFLASCVAQLAEARGVFPTILALLVFFILAAWVVAHFSKPNPLVKEGGTKEA